MHQLLYTDLVPWYRLLDTPEDHSEEAACFAQAFQGCVSPAPRTLLELGAGAGNGAAFLKQRFSCTLTDLSPAMLNLSQAVNPECEHIEGDMRTLRLNRVFDVVLVHDAIAYMLSERDLLAAATTAFVHTRPGGAAIFAPDCVRETLRESSQLHMGEDGSRALRCVDWTWDPDPNDDTYVVEYAFLLRHGGEVQAVHDTHTEGVFARSTWYDILGRAGYLVEPLMRPLGDGEMDEIFLCRRP